MKKKLEGKRFLLPIITICVITMIMCIVVIARGILNTSDEISIPVLHSNTMLFDDRELNASERVVLTMLLGGIGQSGNLEDNRHDNNTIYYESLERYFSSYNVNLSITNRQKAVDYIKELNEIVSLEKESDMKKMSLDGRGVAIYLSEQIYELCGLKLEHNLQGDIVQITSQSDNFIYLQANPNKQAGFQPYALMITLVIILTLLSICIIIAKKNHLFVKDVTFNGYDEKGFA